MTGPAGPSALRPPDATELAAEFAAGRAHPRAAVEGLLARIDRLDPLIGACNGLAATPALCAAADAAAARWRAGRPRSSLDGIAFGVKANIAVAGLPWHAGVAALRDRVAATDSVCVGRLRAAGLIPVAVLNMHEAALGVTSDNPAFRTTCNPWARDRIPGGSSGGSAAAVASGMLPVALGTDDLGSVRLPSALCGVVGFKPGYGEVPTGGVVPLCGALDHVGIHARSVRDIAAVLAIVRGRRLDLGEPAVTGLRPRPPLAHWLLGEPGAVDRQVDDAFRGALDHMAGGAAVGETLDWSRVDLSRLRRAGLLLCERDAARHFGAALRACSEDFSPEFRELVSWGARQRPARVRAAQDCMAWARDALVEGLRDRLLASPTTPHTAPLRGAPIPPTLSDFTVPAAVAGVPAVSVPVRQDAGGLPVGVQVTGAVSEDVLAAAAALFPGTAPVAEQRGNDRLMATSKVRGP